MKFSIITVVYNAKDTIERTIKSVIKQKNVEIQYILIDGASNDGTIEILKANMSVFDTFISESDGGIYDAMNKGIALANGNIINFLNADDYYNDEYVLSKVARLFSTEEVDVVFGDLIYFSMKNPNKVTRYYSGKNFTSNSLKYGLMPPHPATFIKRNVYENYGLFDTNFKIAGDFEFILRIFFYNKVKYKHLPEILIRMQSGGISNKNFSSALIINKEIIYAFDINKIKVNKFMLLIRYFIKLKELRLWRF